MKFLTKLLLLVLLIGAAAAGYAWYAIENPYGTYSGEGIFVDVPHGASSRGVARLLEKNGVIRNAIAFEIYARKHPRRTCRPGNTISIMRSAARMFSGRWQTATSTSVHSRCAKARRCTKSRANCRAEN